MYADLHLHSTYSDGTDTPAELIELAANRTGMAATACPIRSHIGCTGLESPDYEILKSGLS